MRLTWVATPRLMLLAGLVLLATTPAALTADLAEIVIALDLLILAMAVLDGVRCPDPRRLEIRREVAPQLPIGRRAEVRLAVTNPTDRPVTFSLLDDPDARLNEVQEERTRQLPARSVTRFSYPLRPMRRGVFEFGPVHLATRGPLGLIERRTRIELEAQTAVWPDLRAAEEAFVASGLVQPHLLGRMRVRGFSDGQEFSRLRAYIPGDDTRKVDWKASARARRPIVREFEPERCQNVILWVDAGRMMSDATRGLSKLDHAINSAIAVARVAVQSGDRVGLIVTGAPQTPWLPPDKGVAAVTRVLEELAPLQVSPLETDFVQAVATIRTRLKRRSLVLLYTDLALALAPGSVLGPLGGLMPPHLLLLVTLRNLEVEGIAEGQATDGEGLALRHAAQLQWEDQRALAAHLRARGAWVAEAPPDRLVNVALAQYLEIKRRGAL